MDVDPANQGYAWQLVEDYLRDPAALVAWRERIPDLLASHPSLRDLDLGRRAEQLAAGEGKGKREDAVPLERLLTAMAQAMALVRAYRSQGHLAADLDPLGAQPPGEPFLDSLALEPPLLEELARRLPAAPLAVFVPGQTLSEVLAALREVYCSTTAYEIEHISSHEERSWLCEMIESGRYRRALVANEQRVLLERLAEVEGLERYLRRSFLGQKQFSLEGLDTLVPMIDEALERALGNGAHEAVIGMAHRGRLNVLAHVVGLPYEDILREFEGEKTLAAIAVDPEGGSGDVKYHLGAQGSRRINSGEMRVVLAANPSHLEAVDPVVCGMSRALESLRASRHFERHPQSVLPLLIHGDASFAGQGVVAETLNLANLAGYSVGGTLHIIANNQVGFTTTPKESRSTFYASDLAKGYDVPIVHVNADDPEAALAAVRLAMAYRSRFGKDFVLDLVGYRRHGHNEQDEPAYTQPLEAAAIAAHPPVRALYAAASGQGDGEELVRAAEQRLKEAHARMNERINEDAPTPLAPVLPAPATPRPTKVALARLSLLQEELLALPEGFLPHPKLASQLSRRREALAAGEGIDWGQAESLALGSLLEDGVPVRLTGQDSERGTFSHRHAVLHDSRGRCYCPLAELSTATASFEIHNSPLSEYACLGFEYGYSAAAPEALVLWEAQFGDFVNNAQGIVDQFISAGLSKWRQTARLTMLLPHGYEGNGPEHSSARLERFLQLSAQENIRVVNPTTAAQYFHLLRQQALEAASRPLVVMTPKGLLRLKQASSSSAELAEGSFQPLIDDVGARHDDVERLVLCSGKLYYDIQGHPRRLEAKKVAIARVERLYPFPISELEELVRSYPSVREISWAQEEPQNMGAFRSIRHRLEQAAGPLRLGYAGRPWRASPAEGYPTAHRLEQESIVLQALGLSKEEVRIAEDGE